MKIGIREIIINILFFFRLSLISSQLSTTYEVFEDQNTYPRPLLTIDNDVIAISGNPAKLIKYNSDGEVLISSKKFLDAYEENAAITQLRSFSENTYVLAYGVKKEFFLVVFNEALTSIQTINTNEYSVSFKLNLTPLLNGNILVGWVSADRTNEYKDGKVHVRIYEVNQGSLSASSYQASWATDNLYISCVEMSATYNNYIVCLYCQSSCTETYTVLNTQLSPKYTTTLPRKAIYGCAFDKVISLEEPYIAFCYLENNTYLTCSVHSYISETNLKNVTSSTIINYCDHQTMHTDVAYFSNNQFVATCRNSATKKNPIASFVTFTGTTLTSRIIELTPTSISYPFASRFGTRYYAIFYHLDTENQNVYEILDLPFCRSYSQAVEVYVNKETSWINLENNILKTPGIYDNDSTVVPKLIFEHLPDHGKIEIDGKYLTEENKGTLFPKNKEFRFIADGYTGEFKVTFAGIYKEEEGRGKLCTIYFKVNPCQDLCYSCTSASSCEHNCKEGSGYYQFFDKPTFCSKGEEGYYLNKDTTVSYWKKCGEECKTCSKDPLVQADSTQNHCDTCKEKNSESAYILEGVEAGNCYTEEEGKDMGYYLDQDNKILKKCYETCGTCTEEGSSSANNCETCISNPPSGNSPTFGFLDITGKCDYSNSTNDGYYLDKDSSPNLWKQCYTTCETCDKAGSDTEHNCGKCKEDTTNPYYKIDGTNNCVQSPSGYYLYDPGNSGEKVYKPCDTACKKCYGDPDTNNFYTNCIECNDNYFPYEDNEKKCEKTPADGYYKDTSSSSSGKVTFKKCHENCKTCTTGGDDSENNCDKCKEDTTNPYYKIDGTNTCKNQVPSGYYFDNGDNKYKKCHENCKTCTTAGDNNENNCKDCKEDKDNPYYKIDGSDTCTNQVPSGYYLDKGENKYKKCHENCKTCTSAGNNNENNCDKCKEDKTKPYYKIDGTNTCTNQVPSGYYFDNGENKYKKCHENCKTCTTGGDDNENNCDECKEDTTNPYYKIDGTNTCKNQVPSGYYLDNGANKYKKCHKNCKTCSIAGNDSENNCNECKEDASKPYYKIDGSDTCTNQVPSGYYLDNKENKYKKCHQNCLTCTSGGDDSDNNCETCPQNYFRVDNERQCRQVVPDHYYKETDGTEVYKPCHKSCDTCSGGTENDCLTCLNSGNYYNYYSASGALTCVNIKDKKSNEFLDKSVTPNTIKQCTEPCASCEDQATKCTSCIADYYPFFKNQNTCSKDPENNYLKDDGTGKKMYYPCYETCKYCTGEGTSSDNKCTECISGATQGAASGNEFNCYFNCQDPNEKLYNGQCMTCAPNLAESGNVCVNCKKEGGFHIENSKTCLNSIQSGYYDTKDEFGTIKPCSENCLTCETETECTSCKPDTQNKYLLEKKCLTACPNYLLQVDDTQNNQYSCKSCSPKFKNINKNECDQNLPPGGKLIDSTYNSFDMCYPSCFSCSVISQDENDQSCEKCLDNYYFQNKDSHNCVQKCDKNLVRDATTKTCINCKTHFTPEKYKDVNDDSECKDSMPQNAKIIDETTNTYTTLTCFANCETCSEESTNEDDQKCKTCAPNYYMAYGTNNCVSSCGELYGAKESPRVCVNCKEETPEQFKFRTESTCTSTKPNDAYIEEEEHNIIKKCDEKCSECNDLTGECKSCNVDQGYDKNPAKKNSDPLECVKLCKTDQSYWYIDTNGKYSCTKTKSCKDVEGFSVLEETQSQCVKDCSPSNGCLQCKEENRYEYNGVCETTCPEGYKEEGYKCEVEEVSGCKYTEGTTNSKTTSDIPSLVTNELKSYLALAKTNNKVYVIKGSNYAVEFFMTDECQTDSSNKYNLTYLDLESCNETLKRENKISDIVFAKVDIYQSSGPNKVVYQPYSLKDGKKLDISKCNNITVDFPTSLDSSKARLAGSGINVFDKEDPFFNDFCYPYYDENGKDVVLKDRRADFYQSMAVCEDGCSFTKVNFKTAKVECNCDASKNSIDKINSIIEESPVDDFTASLSMDNFIVVRCYNLVFNWNYMKRNIGSWIILLLFVCQWPALIIFFIVGLKPAYSYLNQFSIEKERAKLNSAPPKRKGNDSITERSSESESEKQSSIESQSLSSNRSKNANDDQEETPEPFMRKKGGQRLSMLDLTSSTNHKGELKARKSYSRNKKMNYMENKDFSEKQLGTELNLRSENSNTLYEGNEENKEEFDEEDLNEMVYDDARENDKRNFFKVLWCCLKLKIIILSPFCYITPLEPFCIKIVYFFLNISLYLVINAMLFTQDQISKRYDAKNITVKYFIQNELPRTIYASLAASVIGVLLSFITSTKKRFKVAIEKEEDPKEFLKKVREIVKSLKCKMFSFCLLNLILMCMFWYYISAFCAVYQKSQKPWLLGSGFTFLFCLIFQSLYALIITSLRFIGLKCKVSCAFTISKYML